jgi:Xaa-Pro aminopeptidase
MARDGLAAVLVTEKYNYWHFTGHLSREFDKKMRPQMLLLPVAAPATLIVFAAEAELACCTCPAARVLAYADVPFSPDLIVEAIRTSGLEQARIGMEFGENDRLGLSVTHLDHVRHSLPSLRLVDAGALFDRLRMIKQPDEIDLIAEACRISLAAWARTLPQLRVGMTNADVAAVLGAELCRGGHDFNTPGHVTVGNGVAGRDGYRAGDVLWADFGATWRGYQADLSRRAVFGPPSAAQRRQHADAIAMLDAMIAAIRPGARCSDVAAIVDAMLRKRGYAPLGARRIGHGLGLSAGEPPSLGPMDDTVLAPGMVVTPEPVFALPSGERVHVEEAVVVTADGCEKLTDGAATLAVLPA